MQGADRTTGGSALDRVCALAASFGSAQAFVVSQLDADHQVISGAFGLPAGWMRERGALLPGSLAASMPAGHELVVDDTRAQPALTPIAALTAPPVAAYVILSLASAGGQVVGWFAAFSSAPRSWTEDEIQGLRALAAIAAPVVELCHVLDAAQHARRTAVAKADAMKRANTRIRLEAKRLEVMLDLSHRLAAESDSRSGVCEATSEIVDATAALLWEPSADGERLSVTAEHGVELMPLSIPISAGSGAEVEVFVTASRGFIASVDGRRRIVPTVLSATRAHSLVLEPVVGETGVLGVLEVAWPCEAEDLPRGAISLLGLLTLDAAAAIERARVTRSLVAEARTDPLTGLPNRRAWDEQLPRELAHAQRLGYPTCVAIADLDEFKRINDREGHAAGDRLLNALAIAWKGELRGVDLIARLGGDEFALILPGCTSSDAAEVAGRLHRRTPEAVTASIGIAGWTGNESASALQGRADRALYEAKQRGEGTVIAAAPGGEANAAA